jgi:N-methylhydantoinase A
MTTEGHVGMWPNRAPQIEIKTVGAGGGSIAYLDPGKFLNVGPRSSGAIPGPACYGRGGTEPTVTDANVVLGRFRPDLALGGEINLDEDAARTAVAGLGEDLGLTPERTAEGIVRLAVARMTATVKEISVMRGLDPRDFTLFAYGGAGPLHAAAIAEELGITEIVIPPMPGAFSAYGLLTADTRYDVTRTRLTRLEETTLEELQAFLDPLREEARDRLRRDGFNEDDIRLQVFLDMRFVGQAFELTTPMPDTPNSLADLAAAFQAVYEERYAENDTAPAEIVSFRVVGLGTAPSVELPKHKGEDDAQSVIRKVSFDSDFVETVIHRREALPVDTAVPGPAIIEEDGATSVVPPGFNATLDRFGILTLRRVDND